MNYLRYVPIICVIGAIVGVISITQLWIHGVTGFEWSSDLTGIDLMGSDLDGFQKYLPIVICAFSVLAAIMAILTMTVRRLRYGIFICMIFGIVVLVLTTVFSMWTIDGERIVHFVSSGFWLSYAAGGLILIGAAIQYSLMFIKPRKSGR